MSVKDLTHNQNYGYENEVWLRIAAFLDSKAYETQRTYKGVIQEWTNFLGGEIGTNSGANLLINANDLHVIAYKRWLEEQPGQNSRYSSSSNLAEKALSKERSAKRGRDGTQNTLTNSTINKKFSALRRIYRMLIASNLKISSNPFDVDKVSVPSSKAGQKRPTEMLEFNKVKRVLNSPDTTTNKGKRDYAILCLLFGAGLRRSEVVNLRLADFKTSSQGKFYLLLRATKSRKDFEQAIPKFALNALQDYLEVRRGQKAKSGDPIFNSYLGQGGKKASNKALSDSGLYKMFKKYCKMADLNPHLTPHSARATAITKLLHDGFNHREVQEFSRHSSVQMVEVYDKRRLNLEDNPGLTLDYDVD